MIRASRSINGLCEIIVEPVFEHIKQAQGLRSFLPYGLEEVCAEWALICTTHNLPKLYRLIAS
jgi:hypothetical protein